VMQTLSGWMACVVVLPALMIWHAPVIAAPMELPWGLLLTMGLFGALAHLSMNWSLRFAPASTVAPMQYLEIPVAAVIGLAMFGDFPNWLELVGIALTIGAGLYAIYREQQAARAMPHRPQSAAE